jgi:hypothetical protein
MLNLISYVTARLEEDEAYLREVIAGQASAPAEATRPTNAHRMLADVAAKRTILELHGPLWPDDTEAFCRTCGDPDGVAFRATWPCATVLALAAPYVH